MRVESEARDRAILARVNVPVFVVEGLPGVLAGWTDPADDAPVQMVLVRHELDEGEELSIEVDTERGELDSEVMAARCLATVGGEASSSSMLPVDGVDREFVFAQAGEHWVAVGAVDDVVITIDAEGVRVKDVHLRALANPTGLLEAGIPAYRPSGPRRGATPVRGCSTSGESWSSPRRHGSRISRRHWPRPLSRGSPCWPATMPSRVGSAEDHSCPPIRPGRPARTER